MDYQRRIITPASMRHEDMELAAMIAGIIGILGSAVPVFGCVVPSIAAIFGVLGRGGEMQIKGKGLAGLIMGIIGIVLNFIFTIAIITFALIYMVNAAPDFSTTLMNNMY